MLIYLIRLSGAAGTRSLLFVVTLIRYALLFVIL